MAVLTFNDVYRSGSAVGSPVATYYITDSYTEIPVGIDGDLAYAKDLNLLYLCHGGSSWEPLIGQNLGYPLNSNLILKDGNPTYLTLDNGGGSKATVMNLNGQLFLCTNCYWNGTWIKQDTNLGASVQVINFGSFDFYRINSDGSATLVFSINTITGNIQAAGNLFELNRAFAVGNNQNFPFDSGYFVGAGGMVFTPSMVPSSSIYKYSLIGDTLNISIFVSGTISGVGSTINIYTPYAIYKAYNYEVAAATGNNNGVVIPCRVYTNPNFAYISFEKMGSNFVAGTLDIGFQISIHFYQ